MSRTSPFGFPVPFRFLAAVDFLLRMDFVMLVVVLLSLFCFILWPDQRAKGRGPGVVVVVL